MREWLKTTPQGVDVFIRVKPNGRKNEITGFFNQRLAVTLNAPPVEGKANNAVCRFFSKILKTAATNISVKHGLKSREKTLQVLNVTEIEVLSVIDISTGEN